MCETGSALDAWRRWREFVRVSGGGSENTVRTYSGNVLRFLAETGAKEPADYLEDDLVAFLARWAPQGRAKYEYLKALRSFFGWAARNRLLVVDPTEYLKARKPRRVAPVVLTDDELARLFAAAVAARRGGGERAAWALRLMYVLGLRRMELAGLRWSDVHDTAEGPALWIRTTKGADQRAALPLEAPALECLDRLRVLPRTVQSLMGPEYIVGVKASTVSAWAHKAGTRAGLAPEKIGAHRLRATRATSLLRGGVDVRIVQRVLGHAHLSSTAFYLGEPEDAAVRSALARS